MSFARLRSWTVPTSSSGRRRNDASSDEDDGGASTPHSRRGGGGAAPRPRRRAGASRRAAYESDEGEDDMDAYAAARSAGFDSDDGDDDDVDARELDDVLSSQERDRLALRCAALASLHATMAARQRLLLKTARAPNASALTGAGAESGTASPAAGARAQRFAKFSGAMSAVSRAAKVAGSSVAAASNSLISAAGGSRAQAPTFEALSASLELCAEAFSPLDTAPSSTGDATAQTLRTAADAQARVARVRAEHADALLVQVVTPMEDALEGFESLDKGLKEVARRKKDVESAAAKGAKVARDAAHEAFTRARDDVRAEAEDLLGEPLARIVAELTDEYLALEARYVTELGDALEGTTDEPAAALSARRATLTSAPNTLAPPSTSSLNAFAGAFKRRPRGDTVSSQDSGRRGEAGVSTPPTGGGSGVSTPPARSRSGSLLTKLGAPSVMRRERSGSNTKLPAGEDLAGSADADGTSTGRSRSGSASLANMLSMRAPKLGLPSGSPAGERPRTSEYSSLKDDGVYEQHARRQAQDRHGLSIIMSHASSEDVSSPSKPQFRRAATAPARASLDEDATAQGGLFEAKWTFQSKAQGELALARGDIVRELRDVNDDWSMGELVAHADGTTPDTRNAGDRCGIYPRAYVVPLAVGSGDDLFADPLSATDTESELSHRLREPSADTASLATSGDDEGSDEDQPITNTGASPPAPPPRISMFSSSRAPPPPPRRTTAA